MQFLSFKILTLVVLSAVSAENPPTTTTNSSEGQIVHNSSAQVDKFLQHESAVLSDRLDGYNQTEPPEPDLVQALRQVAETLQAGNEKSEQMLDTIKNLTEGITSLLKFNQISHPPIEAASDILENDMTRLHRFLHKRNKDLLGIRPKRDIKAPTIVTLDVDIYQIIEMSDAEEYIKAYIHVNMTFYNEYLGWNPANFGGIRSTVLNAFDEMWIPDIFAYNGVDMKNENLYFRPHQRITTNFIGEGSSQLDTLATVEYSYPRIVKFSCSFETYYFPFDYQLCVLIFRSWSYPKQELYVVPGVHTKNYTKKNDEWTIVSISQYSKLMQENSSDNVFSVHEEEILLKRRPFYYIVNLLIPSVIITQVAFFGFFSPSSSEGDRTEKVNLGMGTLLAMSVLLLTVCEMTPVSSDHIPLTGTFFLFNMVLICVGIIMTSFIMTVHQRGKRMKRVPKIVQTVLFFRIAPVMGFKIPTIIRRSRNQLADTYDSTNTKHSHEILDDSALLEKIPQVKKLKEHIDSIVNGRQKELSEVEYIFLAKILDGIMLLCFSLVLYIAFGCVVAVGLTQPIPGTEHKQMAYRNSIVYKDERRRLDDETIFLYDTNRDGFIQREEMRNVLSGRKNGLHVPSMIDYMFEKDNNNDTKINRAELDSFSQEFHAIAEEYDDRIISMVNDADKNFDYKLDYDEFIGICESIPELATTGVFSGYFLTYYLYSPVVIAFKFVSKGSIEERNKLCSKLFGDSDYNGDRYIHAIEASLNLLQIFTEFEKFGIAVKERMD